MSAAIEDYGIIGDCESVALVGRNGYIAHQNLVVRIPARGVFSIQVIAGK
jgi:hypothetical protein